MIRVLIALFPRHFRDAYGDDMRDVFRDQLAAARRSGHRMAVPALWIRTALLMTGAALPSGPVAISSMRRGSGCSAGCLLT